jgi:hypothetical protein
MHRAMMESGRSWPASELARAFLRMQAIGPMPEVLLRGMLAADARFREESAGVWSANARPEPRLADGSYVLAWLEQGEARSPASWRAFLRLPDGGAVAPGTACGASAGPLAADDPRPWQQAWRAWGDRRLITLHPGPLGRFLQWLSRRWALPEWSDPLDLLSLGRYALVEEGAPISAALAAAEPRHWMERWRLGPIREDPPGVPLPAIAALWEHLLERYGGCGEGELLARIDAALGVRPVSFERFHFQRADLEAVPDGSGVYRFLGDGDEVLYVGKALRLRRRVQSYFRPLPAEAGKRDQLLARIRRFEITEVPSELEALVLETRGIREHRPAWNVQVEVHEPERLPPDWWWPLLFVAPGEDPGRATAILLHDAESGWLFHLPRADSAEEESALAGWLGQELAIAVGEPVPAAPRSTPAPAPSAISVFPAARAPRPLDPPADALRLELPEARLALRFYLRERDRLERLETLRHPDAPGITAALLRAARAAPAP